MNPIRWLGTAFARAIVTAAGLPRSSPVRVVGSELASYEAAADRVLTADGSHIERAALPEPVLPFLCWLADHRPVLFHGSARDDIEELAPVRLSSDTTAFGNQQAVFATSDPIWASWFAVVTRDTAMRSMCNASIGLGWDAVFPRWYYFSVNRADGKLAFQPGTLYVVPSDGFTPEPRKIGIADTGQLVRTSKVRPIARLTVEPADVPFIDRTVTHSDKDGELRTILRFGRAHRRSLGRKPKAGGLRP